MSRVPARAGATRGVQRALGWTNAPAARSATERATCLLCGTELRFATGAYGQTLEICTSETCPGRAPHHPQPDPSKPKHHGMQPRGSR